MDGDPGDPVAEGQGWRERTGDGDDVLNVDEEGGGLRALAEPILDVVEAVDDDHGEVRSDLEEREVGVGEDEARGGGVFDSRPDNSLLRWPPPSCPPSFLFTPNIFPELLQSCTNCELSLFQLDGEK